MKKNINYKKIQIHLYESRGICSKIVPVFLALIFIVGLFFGNSQIFGNGSKQQWPLIETFKKSVHFTDHKNVGVQWKILGIDGKPLYLLECYLNAYDREDHNFDYSGDFECRLTSLYSKEVYSTLLTDEKHPTRDWQSRGRFLINEITGKCAAYPEYGRRRQFKLRGMDIKLEVKNVKVKPDSNPENPPQKTDRIKELDFYVTVASDSSALSEIAEKPQSLESPCYQKLVKE